MTKTERLLKERSDIQELVAELDLDDVDILKAAKKQPGLYLKASRYRVQKMRLRIQKSLALDVLKTELASTIREKDRLAIQKKLRKKEITEAHIKEKLFANPSYVAAMKDLSRAESEEEFAKRLLDAYDHRGKALRIVADMIGAEIAMERKLGEYKDIVNLKKDIKSKYPGGDSDDEET